MKPFAYHRPDDLTSALSMLRELGESAKPLAGGTDLLIELRKGSRRVEHIEHLVDVSRLDALKGVRIEGAELHLGPMSTHEQMACSPMVLEHLPLLAAGAASVGCLQTRNQGTLGGNIINASACADTIPGLVCYGARLVLKSSDRVREIPLSDFIERPYRTALETGELLVDVVVDVPRFVFPRWDFYKLGRRNAMAISRLTVAAVLDFDGATIIEARIATGSATPRPHRMANVERGLVGKTLQPEVIETAARQMADDMVAETGVRWSTAYKRPVLENITRRVLARIADSGVSS